MLTIESLRAYGANTEEGLARCLNNEAFYLRLVRMGAQDRNFMLLEEALDGGNTKAAFEAAHALKGVMANLSLTPILEPVAQITELLRHEADAEYLPYRTLIRERKEELIRLIES
ncbi:MAG: Hpt domain-containing protein [Clostridia bacterium]|jgi:hypothetical protein|nr:Hpt domain-containing protein [Clostridia bacterium]MBR0436637.1 Hpt domain-containing protein [Clostridia bacterium]MBR2643973.1 Hpt domain-containing protein [Clostridia bacterium]